MGFGLNCGECRAWRCDRTGSVVVFSALACPSSRVSVLCASPWLKEIDREIKISNYQKDAGTSEEAMAALFVYLRNSNRSFHGLITFHKYHD